jgi:hypothetical protein
MDTLSPTNRKGVAIGLVLLGALFLLGQLLGFSLIGAFWPLFVIAPGLPFLWFAINGDRKTSGLIFPGLIITGTGLILLYQNLTGHWASWAYAWALYPALVGAALQFQGTRLNKEKAIKTGRVMARTSLIGFLGLGLLFEFLIFGGLLSWLLPVLLLVGGFYLITRDNDGTASMPREKAKMEDKPKNDLQESFDGFEVKDSSLFENGPSADIDPELQRKIDEALREDGDDTRA